MNTILGVLVISGFAGLYVVSSALYERVFHKKASYGCSGGCAGCSKQGNCSDEGKGGH